MSNDFSLQISSFMLQLKKKKKAVKGGQAMAVKLSLSNSIKPKERIHNIPVDLIERNPNQPRKVFQEAPLFELAESIRVCGIIQPLNVRKISENKYELISGERRLKASKLIGLKTVPAIVMNIEEETSAVIALIENLQREDLSFFEEALAYEKLIQNYSFTQEALAFKLGKSQSAIANKMRLLKLNDDIKAKVVEYNLTERHCRSLLKISDEDTRMKVVNTIIAKNMNVTEAENYIEELKRKNIAVEKKERRVIPLFKDIRIFSNTVKQAVDMMKKAGVNADSKKKETDEYIEYFIRIEKNAG